MRISRTRSTATLAVVAVATALTGCSSGAADDLLKTVGNAARSHLDDPSALRSSPWLTHGVDPAAVPVTRSFSSADQLLSRLRDLDRQKAAIDVGKAACEADALYSARKSDADAQAYIVGKFPNAIGYRQRALDLYQALQNANSDNDVAKVLGKAAFCEAISHAE